MWIFCQLMRISIWYLLYYLVWLFILLIMSVVICNLLLRWLIVICCIVVVLTIDFLKFITHSYIYIPIIFLTNTIVFFFLKFALYWPCRVQYRNDSSQMTGIQQVSFLFNSSTDTLKFFNLSIFKGFFLSIFFIIFKLSSYLYLV